MKKNLPMSINIQPSDICNGPSCGLACNQDETLFSDTVRACVGVCRCACVYGCMINLKRGISLGIHASIYRDATVCPHVLTNERMHVHTHVTRHAEMHLYIYVYIYI